MQNSNDKIHIFHHVYLNECGLNIALQQLHLLSIVGLLDHTNKLNIGIVHNNVELLVEFLKAIKKYDTNNNIVVFPDEPNLPSDERRTGLFLKKFADESNGDEKILYIHTKGASRHDTPHELAINYWRQYLEFFNIVNWKDCVDALNKGYDSCGVMWTEATWNSIQKSGKHYAGSFYWIKSQVIKRIPTEHFSDFSKYERYAMEAVPSLIDHKALCLHKLGPEIKNPYHDIIYPKLYVETNDKKRIQTEIITSTPLLAKPTKQATTNKIVVENKGGITEPKLSIDDFVKSSMNTKVVYTCIINNYDMLNEPLVVSDDWDYICFSDKYIESKHWNVVKIPKDCLTESGTLVQRKVKVLPHKYLDNYDISIWIDGNIQPKVNLDTIVHTYHKKNFSITAHPFRTCIYDEMLAVQSQKKESTKNIETIRQKYLKEGYPKNNGLVQSNVIIRNHNTDFVKTIGNNWWNLIKENSHRDQLTFNYFLWKYPNLSRHVHIFGADVLKKEFSYYKHKSNELVDLPKNYGNMKNFINGTCFYKGFDVGKKR